jgi:hypothetical protein
MACDEIWFLKDFVVTLDDSGAVTLICCLCNIDFSLDLSFRRKSFFFFFQTHTTIIKLQHE